MIAVRIAQQFLADAGAPVVGDEDDLAAVLAHRAALRAQDRVFPEAVLHG